MTHIYKLNGDNPELIAESCLLPEDALTAYRDSQGYDNSIIHIGYSSYACVTTKGLFYARKAK